MNMTMTWPLQPRQLRYNDNLLGSGHFAFMGSGFAKMFN